MSARIAIAGHFRPETVLQPPPRRSRRIALPLPYFNRSSCCDLLHRATASRPYLPPLHRAARCLICVALAAARPTSPASASSRRDARSTPCLLLRSPSPSPMPPCQLPPASTRPRRPRVLAPSPAPCFLSRIARPRPAVSLGREEERPHSLDPFLDRPAQMRAVSGAPGPAPPFRPRPPSGLQAQPALRPNSAPPIGQEARASGSFRSCEDLFDYFMDLFFFLAESQMQVPLRTMLEMVQNFTGSSMKRVVVCM